MIPTNSNLSLSAALEQSLAQMPKPGTPAYAELRHQHDAPSSDEHPLTQIGADFRYRDFAIDAHRNSGGSYYTVYPLSAAEFAAWSAESDDPLDVKMLAQALDAVDAWRDGGRR